MVVGVRILAEARSEEVARTPENKTLRIPADNYLAPYPSYIMHSCKQKCNITLEDDGAALTAYS